jgi:hypothetical protein
MTTRRGSCVVRENDLEGKLIRRAAQQRRAAVGGANGFAGSSSGVAPPRLTPSVMQQQRLGKKVKKDRKD